MFDETDEIVPGVRAGVLSDNGGPVETVALLADAANPALDAGDDGLATGATDARGLPRPVDLPDVPNAPGRTVDLGAFELQLAGGGPEAVDDTAVTTRARAVVVGVLANDAGAADGPEIVARPDHGLALVPADGTVAYVPDEGFVGSDGFTYRITGDGGLADPATVAVEVAAATTGWSAAKGRTP